MDPDAELRTQILNLLTHKAALKQRVSDNTFATFNELKDTLHELSTELDEELDEKIDKRIRIEYRDRGKFEAQIQVAEDILIFAMNTDIFRFPPRHDVYETEYVRQSPEAAFCGVINIYNFLADSFKFNRADDEGYLIGRIFINHQMQYLTQGEGLGAMSTREFGSRQIDRAALIGLLESAIHYSLQFDLFVPPYDFSRTVSLEQFNSRTEHSKFQTGKRLGHTL